MPGKLKKLFELTALHRKSRTQTASNKHWRVYLVGGCLLAAACVGIWIVLNMNTAPLIVSGTVTDPNHQPVALARIYFTDGPAPLPDIAALTDMSGNFSFAVPKPGKYKLGCTADGFATATIPIAVTTGQRSSIEIRLTK